MSSLWKIRSSKGMPVIVLPCPKLCKWIQSVSDLKRTLRLSGGKECFIFESWLELFRPCQARPRPFLFSLQPKKSSNLQKSTKLTFNAWITVKTWCVIRKCRALWGARSTPLHQVLRAKLLMLSAWQDSSDGVSAGGSPPLAHWVRNARIAPCG